MASDTFTDPPDFGAGSLEGLLDTAPVPDLSKYTIGDLRALLREPAIPGEFLRKSQIRPGSYPDNSIADTKLALTVPTALAYRTNWQDYSSSFNTGEYWKWHGIVFLKGLLTKTAAIPEPDTVADLPLGFRPARQCIFLQASGEPLTYTRVDVGTDGAIARVKGGAGIGETDYLSLDGIFFRAA